LLNLVVLAPPLPQDVSWVEGDDNESWPLISKASIESYLITRTDVDGAPAAANKSLAAYNYAQSGWVSEVRRVEIKRTGSKS